MTQALYSAKTGLSAGQTQVDVIANNVANINTTAYKTANVTFQTLFSSTLSSGSSAGTSNGGTNPKQIGMGTQVGSISRNFDTGSVQTTGNSHNLMISGNGYFAVQASNGTQYLTRDGNFSLDSAGNLVTASGCKVVGTSTAFGTKSGSTTISVPTLLNAEVSGTEATQMGSKVVSSLNDTGTGISKGTFTVNVGSSSVTVDGSKFTETTPGDDSQFTYTNGTSVTYDKLISPSTTDISGIKSVLGSYSSSNTYYKGGDGTYIVGTPSTSSGSAVTINQKQQTLTYEVSDSNLSGNLGDLVNNINNAFSSQLSTAGISGTIKVNIVDGGLSLTNTTGETLSSTTASQGSNFLANTGIDTAFTAGGTSTTVPISTSANGTGFTAVTAGSEYTYGATTYNVVSTPTGAEKIAITNATGSYDTTGNTTYYKGTNGTYVAVAGAGANIPTTGTDNVSIGKATSALTYEGSTINESVDIKNVVSADTAASLKDYSIGEDGVVTATYSDGSTLTVTMNANNKTTWKYTSSDKVSITGSGDANSDVDTSNSNLNPASMILQLTTVVNEDGLVASTDNMWTTGPNAGTEYYGVAGEQSFGSLKSGVLEGSNVDMTTELSNMITAQRAIQMNSRVFSTASSILQTIAQLGQ